MAELSQTCHGILLQQSLQVGFKKIPVSLSGEDLLTSTPASLYVFGKARSQLIDLSSC